MQQSIHGISLITWHTLFHGGDLFRSAL